MTTHSARATVPTAGEARKMVQFNITNHNFEIVCQKLLVHVNRRTSGSTSEELKGIKPVTIV